MTSLDDELRVAVEAAREAGAEVERLKGEGLRFGRKQGWELVTEADLRAAELLHARLTAAFPDTGWLSEEHVDTEDRLAHERVWVVDPIDGTREYLEGVPEYAISVGLVVGGRPALGVVYNPASGELFAGTCLDAEELPESPLLPPRIDLLVGRGEAMWNDLPPLPREAEPRGVGSVAYRLALIAEGRGDMVLTGYGRAEWDVAAGVALCRAAGLRATGVLGDELAFNQPEPDIRGLLVAKPGLHRQMSAFLQRYAVR
ncbi:MAG: 3'(2'),5'-bisphosphate nucleotidase CysQ [Dehalococcoidia bacterium]|nr:3'(2'),5'-bisphosphate nucleotidase CysQ [Dehalococcoidia bacterium]